MAARRRRRVVPDLETIKVLADLGSANAPNLSDLSTSDLAHVLGACIWMMHTGAAGADAVYAELRLRGVAEDALERATRRGERGKVVR
jgi:hypothetical protein